MVLQCRKNRLRSGMIDSALPGADLVAKGLAELIAGEATTEALLVSIGLPKLRLLGIDVERPVDDPERRLWEPLARDDPDAAHARYNALVRRLVSFEDALASRGGR